MTTITISLRDDIALQVEAAAKREHKSISEWVEQRLAQVDDTLPTQSGDEGLASGSSYSQEWLAQFGTLANEDSFIAPVRSIGRSVDNLNLD